MSDPRLTPNELTIVQAALAAKYVTPDDVDAALAERNAQLQQGKPAALLPILAQRLSPEQLAHLRGIASGRVPAPEPEHRIGSFVILGELGAGGMGKVYRARDPRLNREVALKVLLPTATPETRERMRREAQASGRLEHPGIVELVTVEEDASGELVIALELVEGGSLKERLVQEGTLPPREAVALTAELAAAIEYAHGRGVLHRDIKPANVLVTRDGRLKLTDFGLAKHQHESEGLTKTGVVMGSPGYMSPEQASGEKEHVDQRTDVYGLGATLFALLTGRPPFKGSMVQVLTKLLTKPPPAPSTFNPDVDPELDAICLAALAPEPEDRTPTAAALREALEDYLHVEGLEPTPPPERRSLLPLVLAGLATVAVAAGLATNALHRSAPPVAVTPSPQPPPGTLSLDERTVSSTDLPGLEVWSPWCIRLEPDGLRFLGSPATRGRIELPVRYGGGDFDLHLTGRLRLLEYRTKFMIDLASGPPDMWRREGGVGLVTGFDAKDADTVRGFRTSHVKNFTNLETGVEYPMPNSPISLRLSYRAGVYEHHVSLGDPPVVLLDLRTRPEQGLAPGSYRVRVLGWFRDAPPKLSPVMGHSLLKDPLSRRSRLDITGARLKIQGDLTPLPPTVGRSVPQQLAQFGRHGRLLLSGRTEEVVARLRRENALPDTDHEIHRGNRYLLAQALAETDPTAAARQIGNTWFSKIRPFPVVGDPHTRWVLHLFTATDAWFNTLRLAYKIWRFDRSGRTERIRVLDRKPSLDLLLTAAERTPAALASAKASFPRFRTYLETYRAAEKLLFLPDAPPERRASWFFEAGCFDRARDLLLGRGKDLTPRGRYLLGLIEFRLRRWPDAIRWFKSIAPDDALHSSAALFLRKIAEVSR